MGRRRRYRSRGNSILRADSQGQQAFCSWWKLKVRSDVVKFRCDNDFNHRDDIWQLWKALLQVLMRFLMRFCDAHAADVKIGICPHRCFELFLHRRSLLIEFPCREYCWRNSPCQAVDFGCDDDSHENAETRKRRKEKKKLSDDFQH